jgi:hypothetical protein
MSGGRCPDRAGLPHESVQAGARTGLDCRTSQVRATGRGPRKLGRSADRDGPSQQGPACPHARATGRVSQAAGGVQTGPWPSPAAVPGAAWAGAGRLGPRLRWGRGPGATDGRARAWLYDRRLDPWPLPDRVRSTSRLPGPAGPGLHCHVTQALRCARAPEGSLRRRRRTGVA